MLLLNFTHPLTSEHLAQLETLTGQAVAEARLIATQLDPEQPFAEQVTALADRCGLSAQEWQTLPLLIVPPALNFIAVALLAELHGRMGYFPACLRLRPIAGSLPPRYEVAEIINLQDVRDAARGRRRL